MGTINKLYQKLAKTFSRESVGIKLVTVRQAGEAGRGHRSQIYSSTNLHFEHHPASTSKSQMLKCLLY